MTDNIFVSDFYKQFVLSSMMRRVILTLYFGVLMIVLHAQDTGGFYPEPDTVPDIEFEYVPTVKTNMFAGRPGRAALYSLILPGAGQAYNKKYWQVPIVWAGVGTVGYFMFDNIDTYKLYRDAYRERLLAELEMREPIENTLIFGRATTDQIRNERDRWNRFRQMTIFAFALTWVANSAQAFVGAHLKDFDISDDLSLEILPFSAPPDDNVSITNYTTPISAGVIIKF